MVKQAKPTVGQIVPLAKPARLAGLKVEITKVVHRHGYATGKITASTRDLIREGYSKGTELHLPFGWLDLPKEG